jgi:hypothetical protein
MKLRQIRTEWRISKKEGEREEREKQIKRVRERG